MRPAGLAAFEARVRGADRDLLVRAADGARSATSSSSASRRTRRPGPTGRRSRRRIAAPVTHWVSSAKREETRERRFLKLLEDSRAGRRTGPFA